MRRAISDPTAGEKAREIAGSVGPSVRPVDPTDASYPELAGTHAGSDPTEPQPVGHVLGHRRDEPLPAQDPSAAVLRLRGFRRVGRGRRARGM